MHPGVRSHGMKADHPGYLWSKYEWFLMNGSPLEKHFMQLCGKLVVNFTYVTHERACVRTERRTLYTPRYKCRGYKIGSLQIVLLLLFLFFSWKIKRSGQLGLIECLDIHVYTGLFNCALTWRAFCSCRSGLRFIRLFQKHPCGQATSEHGVSSLKFPIN